YLSTIYLDGPTERARTVDMQRGNKHIVVDNTTYHEPRVLYERESSTLRVIKNEIGIRVESGRILHRYSYQVSAQYNRHAALILLQVERFVCRFPSRDGQDMHYAIQFLAQN